jgi:NTE family protein
MKSSVFFTMALMTVLSLTVPQNVSAQAGKASGGAQTKDRSWMSATGFGLNPQQDSIALSSIQERMAAIHKRRPTVALVLSGGGAKGAAHVGVIKYLESIGMPIDMVLGTSMGGLVGSLYSLGYRPEYLDSLIRSIDWNNALSDRVPREYISYNEKKYKEKYLLSFPFYYRKEDFVEQKTNDLQYSAQNRYQSIHFGANGENPTSMVKDNLLGSLPSGYIYGQNVNNIISSLTVGYQDSVDFFELPIPFVCVSTDMVSGKAKVWYDGKVNTAMRSTMSIPGIFAPVRINGMILTDGGMRDNYPTDLARQMGADIIIGVELSDAEKTYAQINNLGDIINQGIDMLGKETFEKNVKIPDVNIKPDLHEYNMLSFDPVSVDTIISRGYQAALKNADALAKIKSRIGRESLRLHNHPSIDINETPVRIWDIDITGVKQNEKNFLMEKLDIHPGDYVTRKSIENAVAIIFGTGAFDYVTYELLGADEPYHLKLNCKKGPVNQLGIGGRFDSEEIVSVLIDLGINTHKLQGSSFDFTAKVGSNPYFQVHYSFDTPHVPTINVLSDIRWIDRNTFTIGESLYNIAFFNWRNEIFFSNMHWSMFDVNTGIRHEYYGIRHLLANNISGDYNVDQLSNNFVALFTNFTAETFDDGYFPTKGIKAGLKYYWTFGAFPNSFENFHSVQIYGSTAIPFSRVFTLIPSFNMRFLLGNNVPIVYANVIGGSMAGRYVDQQMPFMGVNNAAYMRNNLMLYRCDMRFKLFKNNYLSGIVNTSTDYDEFIKFNMKSFNYGIGLEYSYNSIVGPIKGNVHWSSLTHTVGAYLSLGYDF